MGEPQVVENKEILVSRRLITKYLESSGLINQLTEKERAQFIELALLYGLNPYKREIFCFVYGEGQNRKCSIVTGYEVYLKRAVKLGQLDGWKVWAVGSIQNRDLRAVIEISRKDWKEAFKHEVYYEECVQLTYDSKTRQWRPNKMWAKMPRFMLKKVAIAQGFRLAFPDEFGGMPYADSEIPGEELKAENQAAVEAPERSALVKTLGGLCEKYKNMIGNNYSTAIKIMQSGTEEELNAMINQVNTVVALITENKIKKGIGEENGGNYD